MPAPSFHPRQCPPAHNQLFERILDRVHHDLPSSVGLAVSVHSKRRGDDDVVLAESGMGGDFVRFQLRRVGEGVAGGPAVDAVEHQVPVLSPDLWADDRWPALSLAALQSYAPDHGGGWARVRGAVAVPGVWQADETIVITCLLETPADAGTVSALIGYEQLITAAMVTAAAQEGASDGTEIADMLAVLQSRGAIEQAKGAIMALLRCDADTAWATLRRASHESNVKLRVLAVALVEHISGSPAEQPAVGVPIVADGPARRAAAMLWAVLAHASNAEAEASHPVG